MFHLQGNTCISAISSLSKRQPDGFKIPFNPRGGGCGASMRYLILILFKYKVS